LKKQKEYQHDDVRLQRHWIFHSQSLLLRGCVAGGCGNFRFARPRRHVVGGIAQSKNPNATIKPFGNDKTPNDVVGDWKK
jgi:hypothetical protein